LSGAPADSGTGWILTRRPYGKGTFHPLLHKLSGGQRPRQRNPWGRPWNHYRWGRLT
jgi:hypothetical protein